MNDQIITLAGELAGTSMFNSDATGSGLRIDTGVVLMSLLVSLTGKTYEEVHTLIQTQASVTYKEHLTQRGNDVGTWTPPLSWNRSVDMGDSDVQ
jgi:hypothetical protein